MHIWFSLWMVLEIIFLVLKSMQVRSKENCLNRWNPCFIDIFGKSALFTLQYFLDSQMYMYMLLLLLEKGKISDFSILRKTDQIFFMFSNFYESAEKRALVNVINEKISAFFSVLLMISVIFLFVFYFLFLFFLNRPIV